ncbi:MAG: hypothetical protein ACYDD1_01170 [Caulobacteraceae bacterium]
MLVYGERQRTRSPERVLADIGRRLPLIAAAAPGLERHAALAEAFLDLGMLVQGLADAEVEQTGQDDDTPLQAAAARALQSLARPLIASWRAGFAGPLSVDPTALAALQAHALPDAVRCKTPEGYAYYAVYPEAYAEAAAGIGDVGAVIGLRSIGVTLAAAVAASLDAPPPVTLRPVGHPFQRELRMSPALEARLAEVIGAVVVVDEGPGLSGSSFGAVGDWFEDRGVPAGRLVFLPSHRGEPGAMASERHRRRWAAVRRSVCEFDALAVVTSSTPHRLERWVEDLTGPALAPLQDISGGGWRRRVAEADRPPVYAGQERRKFLLTSASGVWLLKFVGLGAAGRARFERAQRLGDAGFSPRPVGYRYGFMVEPWIAVAAPEPSLSRSILIPALSRYLAFRATRFPADVHDGAGEGALREMISVNVSEGLGASAADALLSRLPSPGQPLQPVRTDGRLHRWEWLLTGDGRLLKTDAVDHDDAHDLIGCQDLAWDVAGAEVEFDLTAEETQALVDQLGDAGCTIRSDVLDLMRPAYAAFQLGLWTHAKAGANADDAPSIARLIDVYARRLKGLAGGA